MTGLRTIWGVSLDRIEAEFKTYSDYLHKQAQKFIDDKLLFIENGL
jgi:oxygen-independent coproporphyrinogen-3 oxidase